MTLLSSPHAFVRALFLATAATMACACGARIVVGEPNRGDAPAGAPTAAAATPPAGSGALGQGGEGSGAAPKWEWISPRPGGDTLRGIWGTSARDVWLVGEHGAVVHYDGDTVTTPFRGTAEDTFYTVWAGGGEVWAAGDGVGGGGSRVAHFDGKAWSTDYAITATRIHALWGASPRDVWAAVDDGTTGHVARWDGARWTHYAVVTDEALGDLPAGTFLRDVWGAEDDLFPWAVGDKGTIARPSPKYDGSYWIRCHARAADSPSDPFDVGLSYVGVWGTRANDVWAMFVAWDGIGFSHWDGAAWRVAQRSIGAVGSPPDPKRNAFASFLPKGPLRRGRPLAGDRSSMVATFDYTTTQFVGGWHQELLWDGVSWSGTRIYPRTTAPDEDLTTKFALYAPAGPGAHVLAAAEFGGLLDFDATRAPLWNGVLHHGTRFNLTSIAPLSDDLAYGTEPAGRLARWNGDGWHEVTLPPLIDTTRGGSDVHPPEVFDVTAHASDDVWAVGRIYKTDNYDPQFSDGWVAHYDGLSWTPTKMPDVCWFSGVWANGPRDVWAVGSGPPFDWTLPSLVVYHFDGTGWAKVPVPQELVAVFPDSPGTEEAQVFGLASDQVWITGWLVSGAPSLPYVLRWDGAKLSVMYRGGHLWDYATRPMPRLWGTSEKDLWLPASPALHFDGTDWGPVGEGTDRDVFAVWGARKDDVWQVGLGATGGAIRHFDGTTATVAVETSPRLQAIAAAPNGRVWAVGQGGATLRLRTSGMTK